MPYSADYLADLMVRMAHHSTAIEGNTLTQGETKSVLIDGYIPRAMDMRELNEILNYKAFMPFLIERTQEAAPLSLSLIREVHALLCRDRISSSARILPLHRPISFPLRSRIGLRTLTRKWRRRYLIQTGCSLFAVNTSPLNTFTHSPMGTGV